MTELPATPRTMRTAEHIAEHHFAGEVSAVWVLKHVRPRVELARNKVRFYDDDVAAWIAARTKGAAA